MSSLSEGTPLSILEAMSSNVPIVSTNVGGLKRIIIDGVNGIMVAAKDFKQLAEAIICLIDDQERAAFLARNANLLVKKDYSLSKTVRDYENIYSSFLSESH